MNPEITNYISNQDQWQEEFKVLRSILLDCGLTEELKWKQPCYTFNSNNVAILGGFKSHCVLSFFKGVLLNDEEEILVSPGENSQSVKMFKFTEPKQIIAKEATIKAYIFEAIEIEKSGVKVETKNFDETDFTEELVEVFEKNPKLKKAFLDLTPGRQRGYNIHFSQPKNASTRYSRIEKLTPKILAGKGMNDCTCGLSKRMPNCDGSHKKK